MRGTVSAGLWKLSEKYAPLLDSNMTVSTRWPGPSPSSPSSPSHKGFGQEKGSAVAAVVPALDHHPAGCSHGLACPNGHVSLGQCHSGCRNNCVALLDPDRRRVRAGPVLSDSRSKAQRRRSRLGFGGMNGSDDSNRHGFISGKKTSACRGVVKEPLLPAKYLSAVAERRPGWLFPLDQLRLRLCFCHASGRRDASANARRSGVLSIRQVHLPEVASAMPGAGLLSGQHPPSPTRRFRKQTSHSLTEARYDRD